MFKSSAIAKIEDGKEKVKGKEAREKGLPYGLHDFPLPFVNEDQHADVAFILGDGVAPDTKGYREANVSDGIAIGFLTLALNIDSRAGRTLPRFTATTWPDAYQETKDHHLIVIGSPKVNGVARTLNRQAEIRFRLPYCRSLIASDKEYSDEDCPTLGVAYLGKNPFNSDKLALLVAGCHGSGTWAAAHAILTKMDDLKKGGVEKFIVTTGIDKDQDGILDDSSILYQL